MLSENRYRPYGLSSHVLLSYYALWLIIFSLFGAELSASIGLFDKIITTLSIATFTCSLVLHGFRFSETADKHRECYLRLQRLYSTAADSAHLAENYHEILLAYPNHASRDYHDFVVQRARLAKDPPLSATGSPICATWYMIMAYWLRRIGFYVLAYAVPMSIPMLPLVAILYQIKWL
jgi:hypothetical protein